jgi:hypothetical protein
MRTILEPYDSSHITQHGWKEEHQWRASVEYGENLASNFVSYGADPTMAALNLAEYIAGELLRVREEAKKL